MPYNSGAKMKILVTGVNGQLGYEAANVLADRGHTVCGCGRSEQYRGLPMADSVGYLPLDITDPLAVQTAMQEFVPDAVIHCAAWTAVDEAEKPENRRAVYSANVQAAETIARCCGDCGAKMVYMSTDYVFDGTGTAPWHPENRNYAPLNVYGRSKLEGERIVSSILDKAFIVRTAWVFGINGNNFVKTVLRAAKTHDCLQVVDDQIGTPTYARDLALLLADMIETEQYGVYHVTNEGEYVSWYEFCCEIFRQAGISSRVIPVSTEQYGASLARRPFNSRLDRSKLREKGFKPLPDWKNALQRFLKELEDGT